MTLSPKRIKNAFARKLQFIREKKGLKISDAAKQLGASTSRYISWEKALDLPRPRELERINAWAWEGKTYAKDAKKYDKYHKGKWRFFRVGVPSRDCAELSDAADALGLSIDDFFAFAAKRYLSNEPVVTHHKQAADEYAEFRALELMNESPALNNFLSGETELISVENRANESGLTDSGSPILSFIEKPMEESDAERLAAEELDVNLWIEEEFYE